MANGITIGSVNTWINMHFGAFEVQYTNDDNSNASITCQFRQQGGSTWLNAIGYRRIDKDTGSFFFTVRGFYFGFVGLLPSTTYEYQITFADPDGVTGTNPVTGTFTTIADNVADPSTLTATKFVDSVNGLDTNTGAHAYAGGAWGAAGPWKTLDHALANCVANDVIKFAAGFYYVTASSNLSTNNVTLIAENLAVQDGLQTKSGITVANNSAINKGSRAVFVMTDSSNNPLFSSPTGSGDPNAGVWTAVTAGSLTGPATGATYPSSSTKLYHWSRAGGFPQTVTTTGYVKTVGTSNTKWDRPTRVPNWPFVTGTTISGNGITGGWSLGDTVGSNGPPGFAEIVATNQDMKHGAWIDNKTNADAYFQAIDSSGNPINPNDCYVFFGHSHNQGAGFGLEITGTGCRVCGIEFRCLYQGISPFRTPNNLIIDHNLFDGCTYGIAPAVNFSVSPVTYFSGMIVQQNIFQDSSLWSLTNTDPSLITWNSLKGFGLTLQSASPGSNQQLQYSFSTGQPTAYGYNGDPQISVFRWNSHITMHDTAAWANDVREDRYNAMGTEIYGEYVYGMQDDNLEFGGGQLGVVVCHDNYGEYCLSGIVYNGVSYGTLYHYNCVSVRTGSTGNPVAFGFSKSAGNGPVPTGETIKFGQGQTSSGLGGQQPPGFLFERFNTYYSHEVITVTCRDGSQVASTLGANPAGGGANTIYLDIKGCIVDVSGTLMGNYPASPYLSSEDWNQYHTTDSLQATPSVRYNTIDNATLAAYQTASSQGAHDQPIHVAESTIGSTSACSSNSTTLTFTIANSLVPGQVVHVTGATPTGYNGYWIVVTASVTQFTVSSTANPGAATVQPTVKIANEWTKSIDDQFVDITGGDLSLKPTSSLLGVLLVATTPSALYNVREQVLAPGTTSANGVALGRFRTAGASLGASDLDPGGSILYMTKIGNGFGAFPFGAEPFAGAQRTGSGGGGGGGGSFIYHIGGSLSEKHIGEGVLG